MPKVKKSKVLFWPNPREFLIRNTTTPENLGVVSLNLELSGTDQVRTLDRAGISSLCRTLLALEGGDDEGERLAPLGVLQVISVGHDARHDLLRRLFRDARSLGLLPGLDRHYADRTPQDRLRARVRSELRDGRQAGLKVGGGGCPPAAASQPTGGW